MTEEKMIELIRTGGTAAAQGIKALYQTYATPIQRFCVAHGTSPADAEDIWQQTVVKIVKAADSFRADGKASAWFWQIARNNLMEHLSTSNQRQQREQAMDADGMAQLDTAELNHDHQARRTSIAVDECVSAGVTAFARVERERAYALTLQMDGFTVEEIGNRIGRTTAATKQYLYEIRKKIAPYIAHCYGLLQA